MVIWSARRGKAAVERCGHVRQLFGTAQQGVEREGKLNDGQPSARTATFPLKPGRARDLPSSVLRIIPDAVLLLSNQWR
jgi:hypothetical protein